MELYSKRKKAEENPPTAYRYDLPQTFRNQVIYIWKSSIGFVDSELRESGFFSLSPDRERISQIYSAYENLTRFLCEEHGLSRLNGDGPCRQLTDSFLRADTDTALDIIQESFRMIQYAQRDRNFMLWVRPELEASDALMTLNRRFQENAIGYRLEEGFVVRLDSEFLHAETVEPALRLLYSKEFEGAFQEFQLALRYQRQGPAHYDDCLTNCLKAVESTLQKIIELHVWKMPGDPKFDNLFAEIRKKGLFPSFLGSHLGELKKFLQAVAVIRNEEGAHGSGAAPNEVPDHLVAYQIHLTGSVIVFLIRCHQDYGKQ